MNIENLLAYQTKDFEIIKLEREKDASENKKILNQMYNVVKDAQAKSATLEKEAGNLLTEYETLKKTYETNLSTAKKISDKNLENISDEDLKAMQEITNAITSNLSVLEKKLLAQAEKVNAVLVEFEQTKKRYNLAREKHNHHKNLFQAENEKIDPKIEKIAKELKTLEKDVNPELLQKYKLRRQDRIYPVFVTCADKSCGGCRMEIPSASLEMLKNKGFLECEHCRRIIFIDKN